MGGCEGVRSCELWMCVLVVCVMLYLPCDTVLPSCLSCFRAVGYDGCGGGCVCVCVCVCVWRGGVGLGLFVEWGHEWVNSPHSIYSLV